MGYVYMHTYTIPVFIFRLNFDPLLMYIILFVKNHSLYNDVVVLYLIESWERKVFTLTMGQI